MRRIHVMAAVIERGEEILLARRPDHLHQGGKWEFPGGKLESGEQRFAGLVRELQEELGITATQGHPLIRVAHDYPDKQVLLDVWRVQAFEGEPQGLEGQEIRWVPRTALRDYTFPAANVPIVTAAQLPSVYVISPQRVSLADFVAELEATLGAGARLLQIRLQDIAPADWRQLLLHLERLRQQFAATFLLNSATAQAQLEDAPLPPVFDGLHLTATDLRRLGQRPQGYHWLAASCHSPEELALAQQVGVDFVTLSPVQPTRSHPDAQPLGWDTFAEWVERVTLPVYGLGGLGHDAIRQAQACGAQGVAGISGFWSAQGA